MGIAEPHEGLVLVPIAAGAATAAGVDALLAEIGDEAEVPRDVLAQTLELLTADPRPAPWGAYLAWSGGRCVGTCAFKAAPDAEGAVEIAYMTWPGCEGQGAATAMAGRLVEIAERAGMKTVRAHTLREDNGSTRCLRHNDFTFVGDVEDPEDGTVWRWERKLPADDRLTPGKTA